MDIIILLLAFLAAVFILVKSADFFVEAVTRIGIALNLPHFLTGVLIVALGTSLPELSTGVSSILKGDTGLVISSVLGSGIANIFLGLGLMILLAKQNIIFKQNIFQVHFPIFAISVMAVVVMLMDDFTINFIEGAILLVIFFAYMWFLFFHDHKRDLFSKKEKFKWKDVVITILSLAAIIISAELAIDTVLKIAEKANIPTSVLGATLVAIGTSLPEMVVVFSAIKKKQFEMAVGNILGSNIFNIVLILGIGSFIRPLEISPESAAVLIPFTIGSFFVYWAISTDKEISRQEGLALTCLYVLFVGKLFNLF